jgi:glucose/arabinose dehydrogenase
MKSCCRVLLFLPVTVLFLLLGCGSGSISSSPSPSPSPAPGGSTAIALQTVVTNLRQPLDLEQPNDGSGRLFVVSQAGTIQIIQNGSVLPTPFLDISNLVVDSVESGLLGLTFHPGFPQNPRFYVNYVRSNAGQIQSVIAEFQVSAANPNQADPATQRILLVANQVHNFLNHKAGQLAFGPDGFLYFGLGDGGSEGDPFNNGQNTQILLGKLMRINVDATSPGLQYSIPPDNPFVAGGGLPEIYAVGFRNPWRFSFDQPTGRLFLADVGQDSFEEVDVIQKGGNYGWSIMEASHCFKPPTGCNISGLLLPIAEIPHPEAEAVIGGFVYHGSAMPGLQGQYIFGDLNGKIWALQQQPSGTFSRTLLLTTPLTITSFGQDQSGELYVTGLAGQVSKIVPQ